VGQAGQKGKNLWRAKVYCGGKKRNCMSDMLEIGHVHIPKKAKLHVGFDGNWTCADFKMGEIA